MFKSVFILGALVALTLGDNYSVGQHHRQPMINASLNLEWDIYKEAHQKAYSGPEEELHRRIIWENNMRIIEKHNSGYDAGLKSYKLGQTKFADMTNAEFRARMLTKVDLVKYKDSLQIGHIGENPNAPLPSSVDWRAKGCVTPVMDQETCGAWAFTAVGPIEGVHCIKTGTLVPLSAQNLIDCSWPEGNQGCAQGSAANAYAYVIKNKGIDTAAYYPFVGRDSQCRYSPEYIGATISSFSDVPTGDEKKMQAATAVNGPVAVAIDASQTSFQLYISGVYDEPACSSTMLDHSVIVVGYGTMNGTADYWIVKNSWGADWGMQGYIYMSRNKSNQCGIATAAVYPIA